MNNLAQYVSHDYVGMNSSSHISYSSGATYDSNADDDSNNDNSNEDDDGDDDDAGNSFWHREFDRRKLVLCIASALALYYNNYIYKQPCMISYNTGMQWLNEILNKH
jgi:hypothetical protein